MYNLLVVDDEAVISKYAAEILRNSDILKSMLLEVRSVFSAYDALNILETYHIDIVLSDISMPGMDGIGLMESIKRRWPHIKVILMSGYNEFEYVQAAIRNDSVDYILKSEGEDQFVSSVKKAIDQLEQELRREEIVVKAAQSLELANGVLRERAIINMLEGYNYQMETLQKYFTEIEMPLDINKPTFLIIGKAAMANDMTNVHIYRIKAFVEEHLRKFMTCVSALHDRRMIWLLQHEGGIADGARLIKHVVNQLFGIQKTVREMLKEEVSFSTDQHDVPWSKIHIKFEQLNASLSMMPSTAADVILVGSNLLYQVGITEEHEGGIEEVQSAIRRLGTLSRYFIDCSRERFFGVFDELMEVLQNWSSCYETIRIEAIFALSSNFLSIINRMSLGDSTNLAADMLLKVTKCENWDETEAFFRDIADRIFQARERDNYERSDKVIEFINKHILEHIDEELSLNRFAELLHYHPSYLSRTFKQATGVSFSDYLANIKMERAKDLLKSSDLKISTIAAALGFESASYFTRFFKKNEGVAPLDYRNCGQSYEHD